MTSLRRDLVATGLTALVLGVYAANVFGSSVWLVGDSVRWADRVRGRARHRDVRRSAAARPTIASTQLLAAARVACAAFAVIALVTAFEQGARGARRPRRRALGVATAVIWRTPPPSRRPDSGLQLVSGEGEGAAFAAPSCCSPHRTSVEMGDGAAATGPRLLMHTSGEDRSLIRASAAPSR